eukprot:512733-Amphidinium_carterae.1
MSLRRSLPLHASTNDRIPPLRPRRDTNPKLKAESRERRPTSNGSARTKSPSRSASLCKYFQK